MSSTPATTLTKVPSSMDLMPPPTRRIKRPPIALSEDIYTDTLSHIIARDFFPGLLENKTKQEYLDALSSGNAAWLASATDNLHNVMTPRSRRLGRNTSLPPTACPTPRGDDDTMSILSFATDSTTTSTVTTPAVDLNLSLTSFHQRYTSEDNESFSRLLDRQNCKRAERYQHLWNGNQLPSPRQILYRKREARLLREGRSDSDTRPAAPDTWKVTQPANQLMFGPDSIEDHFETRTQVAENDSRLGPKCVVHQNTRLPLPAAQTADSPIPPSPSLSAVQHALSRPHRDTASTIEDTGGETPRVNGYAFVDDEPNPSELGFPSSIPTADMLLGSGDNSPNPFQIKEGSRREDLHRRMVEKVHRDKRPTKSVVSGLLSGSSRLSIAGTPTTRSSNGTPIPRFMSSPRFTAGVAKAVGKGIGRNIGGLTPAQERLWCNMRLGKTDAGLFAERP